MIYKEVNAADEKPEINGTYFVTIHGHVTTWLKPQPDYERGVLEEFCNDGSIQSLVATSANSIDELITEYLTNKGE